MTRRLRRVDAASTTSSTRAFSSRTSPRRATTRRLLAFAARSSPTVAADARCLSVFERILQSTFRDRPLSSEFVLLLSFRAALSALPHDARSSPLLPDVALDRVSVRRRRRMLPHVRRHLPLAVTLRYAGLYSSPRRVPRTAAAAYRQAGPPGAAPRTRDGGAPGNATRGIQVVDVARISSGPASFEALSLEMQGRGCWCGSAPRLGAPSLAHSFVISALSVSQGARRRPAQMVRLPSRIGCRTGLVAGPILLRR